MNLFSDGEIGAGIVIMILFFTLILGVTIAGILKKPKARDIIRLWANGQGLVLQEVSKVKSPPVDGWSAAKGYEFYLIETYKIGGDVRSAWLRCPIAENADAADCEVVWQKPQEDLYSQR